MTRVVAAEKQIKLRLRLRISFGLCVRARVPVWCVHVLLLMTSLVSTIYRYMQYYIVLFEYRLALLITRYWKRKRSIDFHNKTVYCFKHFAPGNHVPVSRHREIAHISYTNT